MTVSLAAMPVYLAHATSFCAAVWGPVVDALEGVECVTWDFAGHGSGPELETPVNWATFGEQVIQETSPGGIGVGHSMGACALVMAQLADPDRFRALVLIEPIIFPGPHRRLEHPLSVIAEKRKRSFATREDARANFMSRRTFRDWHPQALEGYLSCGLEGEGPVSLTCVPEVEADIYRASNAHDTWDHLAEVEVPVLVLAGEASDTITPDVARRQAAEFSRAGVEIVPGSGHFLPMERPDLVARRARRLAETIG